MKHSQNEQQRYFLFWRWHFYAGIFVAPFLLVLALTGLGMIFFANLDGRDGERISVTPSGQIQPLSALAEKALSAVDAEKGQVIQYIAPRNDKQVAVFRVNNGDGKATMVAINPYNAEIIKTYPRNQSAYHWLDNFHSDLMLGKTGDYLLETSASLTILMVLTGLFLWWKNRKKALLRVGDLGTGRTKWKNLHGLFGTYTSLMLLLFCVSGLAWAGIWGEKMVQAWSQFPAGKWGVAPVPTSVVPTHGDLNDGKHKEVPWVLEKTPLPQSGHHAADHTPSPVHLNHEALADIDAVNEYAKNQGLSGRYHIYFPKGETGVWTINQDSMSYDSPSPTADRTIHLDRYSKALLADIKYDDYNAFGKFMAVSIAFHMGTMGWWSVLLNVIFCSLIIYLCISGYVMWWKRRPKEIGIFPPAYGMILPNWKSASIILGIVAVIFPTAFIAIAIIFALDYFVIAKSRLLQRLLK